MVFVDLKKGPIPMPVGPTELEGSYFDVLIDGKCRILESQFSST